MRLYSYVVARDFGFAPNPFYGVCSLATCKPVIRKAAAVGDWVVGTGSKQKGRDGYIVFAMKVSEALTFNEYWGAPRFQLKKPFLMGSAKQAYGDNIYFRDGAGMWHQENSHHSLAGGAANMENIRRDTKADRVLIGASYAYWGGAGPKIPAALRGKLCKRGTGHICNFPPEFAMEVVDWIQSLNEWGFMHAPGDW